jgi:hypothetical protein
MRWFAPLVLLVAFAVGCSSSKVTEVVVVVTSALSAPDQVDLVAFQVNEPGRTHAPALKTVTSSADFPLTLGVIRDGGQCAGCSITVTAYRQTTPVFTAEVELVFTEGAITRLQIKIVGSLADGGATDTQPSVDVREPVEPVDTRIPVDTLSPVDTRIPVDTLPPVDTRPIEIPDAAPDLAVPPSCATNCSCVSACTGALTCDTAICQLVCQAGTSCSATAVSGRDVNFQCPAATSCVFDVAKARNPVVTCSGTGSTCDVTCGVTGKCDVTCTDGAACLLTCEGSRSCSFTTCASNAKACSKTIAACGRACP